MNILKLLSFKDRFSYWQKVGLYIFSQEENAFVARPEMVVLWVDYAFGRDHYTPRVYKHCFEDLRRILRTGNPCVDGDGDM